MCYRIKGALKEIKKWSAVLSDVKINTPQEAILGMVDVLGFKEFIEQKQDQAVESYIDIVKEMMTNNAMYNKKIYLTILSDTFIVYSYDTSPVIICKIVNMLEYLRFYLIKQEGLLSRGAIVKGKMYNTSDRKFYDPRTKKELKIDDGIIVSEALVKAARLEKKARYPRILIDDEIKKIFDEKVKYKKNGKLKEYFVIDLFVEDLYGGEKYYTTNFFRHFPQIASYLYENYSHKEYCLPEPLEMIKNGIIKYMRTYNSNKNTNDKIKEKIVYFVDKYNELINELCAKIRKNPFIDKEIISQIEKLHYDANQR